ncbi:MATE family efflux transporter [Labilibacter marinus]|uniref:MATE family efflux transporter n=1 Tax=Labilibacter marinus TaxID=1477105 RepID=UPI0009FAED0B|nr:MATE family efflux transporter [Labilibacter marinus]
MTEIKTTQQQHNLSQRFLSLCKNIWEALMGTSHDYTQIKLSKAIFLLAIPMVLEMVMESIFAIVDIYFVSKLGADAVASVGITESIITIVYSIAFGLSMATTALVARRIGEKRPVRAAHIAWQAITAGIIISLLIAVPGAIFSRQILQLMGASNTLIEDFGGYATIMLAGNVVIMLIFTNNAIFRGAGDAAISLKILVIANGLNIILDPVLILGLGPFPELGIEGAAWATNIGRGVAVLVQFYILFKGSARVKLLKNKLRFEWKRIWKVLNIASGGIFQSLIATASWIGLVRIVSSFGSEAVAGYTIAIRIIIFVLLPSWGLSNAASTLVGQNLGAKHPERAEKSVWFTAKVNMIFLGLISTIFIAWPTFFIELFTQEPNIIKIGSQCLRIVSFGFISYGLGMVLVQSFNGAGDTKTPTKINLVAFWMIEIPTAYVLATYTSLGYQGAFLAIIIAEVTMTSIAFILFKRGKWKNTQV